MSARLACCQIAPVIGEREANRALAITAATKAAAEGADIIVLPELVNSGYVFSGPEEAAACAEPLDGETVRALQGLSASESVTIVAGICEAGEDGRTGNTAVMVEDGELIGSYRKLHLWDREAEHFTPGETAPPVIRSRHGLLGVAICYDLEFPELMRDLSLAGAEAILLPANWPKTERPPGERPMLVTLAMSIARLNGVFVAVCDRAGSERGLDFEGSSIIASPAGWPLAAAGDEDGSETIHAICDLESARDKRIGALNDRFLDRRPEFYGLHRVDENESSEDRS